MHDQGAAGGLLRSGSALPSLTPCNHCDPPTIEDLQKLLDTTRELERARLVAKFLESQFIKRGTALESGKTVAEFLKAARQTLYQGNGSHLANQLLVSKGGLHEWIGGSHLPSFGQVVDIALSLNCSIEMVLTGDASQLPLFPPEFTKRSSRSPRVSRNIKGTEFQTELRRTIRKLKSERGPFSPISLSEIARKMEVDRNSIVTIYPHIAGKVTAEYQKNRSMITKWVRSVRHHAYREAAILIAQNGQLPTRNRVMKFLEEMSVFSTEDRMVCQRICMEVRADYRLQGRR